MTWATSASESNGEAVTGSVAAISPAVSSWPAAAARARSRSETTPQTSRVAVPVLGEAADDDAVDAMGAHQPRHLRQRCVGGATDDAEAHHLADGVLAKVDLGASCGGHLITSSGSSSLYSRKSLADRSALSPIETSEESPIPSRRRLVDGRDRAQALWEEGRRRPGVGAPGAERRVERSQMMEVGDPEAVRADDGCPRLGRWASWRARPSGADLCEAGRQHDERTDALGGALASGLDDGARRDCDDGELDVALDVGARANGRPAGDLAARAHRRACRRPGHSLRRGGCAPPRRRPCRVGATLR